MKNSMTVEETFVCPTRLPWAHEASAEEELLVLSSFARLRAEEVARTWELALRGVDWKLLWELAELNATAPLVHANLTAAGLFDRLPQDLACRFENRSAAIEKENQARLSGARPILERLAERDVPVVILKGALFARTLYHNAAYKKMNDVDILVRKEDLDAVLDVYDELGLFSAAELSGGEPRKQEKFSHHAPPFFTRDLACMVGTHWGLITPLAPYTIDYEAIWSRVEPIDFYGVAALSMAPEDNLHHLVVHLPYYKTGIRELADIYNLLRRHERALNWDLFLREVEKAKTQNLVYHGLSLADRLRPSKRVGDVLEAIRPHVSWYFRRDVARKVASIPRLLRSRSVHMSCIEKAYADFGATREPAQKWQAFGRIWRNILFPPREEVVRFNALQDPGWLQMLAGRCITPWRISRVFVRDLGAKIYVAMLVKLLVDAVKDTVSAPFAGSAGRMDYAAYAAGLGVSVSDLERLKEALE